MNRIALMDLAAMPAPHLDGFGTTSRMVIDWLSPFLDDVAFTVVDVKAGEPLPGVAEFCGFILPGSDAGVYDDRPWMGPLRGLLDEIRAAGKPLLGICFGHQMMAHCFGGRAEKADKGFCLGVREFRDADGAGFVAHVSHQDQVVEVPPGANVTASSGYCPVAALEYPFPAMSMQFHPEYRPDFVSAIATMLDGDLMTEEEARAARASLAATPVRADLFAARAAAFFRRHLPAPVERRAMPNAGSAT